MNMHNSTIFAEAVINHRCFLINLETCTSVCSDLDHLEDAFDEEKKRSFACPNPLQAISILLSTLLAMATVLSPVAMVLLPILFPDWTIGTQHCTIACEGK